MKKLIERLKSIQLSKILDQMDRKGVYIAGLCLSVSLAILSLILHYAIGYTAEPVFYFAVTPILYTVFRKALKPIEPFGERDTIKRMLKTPEGRNAYREVMGILTLVSFAAGIFYGVVDAFELIISAIFQ